MNNLQQRIALVYGSLTKFWTTMKTEKESTVVAVEGETNHLLEMSILCNQIALLLGEYEFVFVH